MRCSLGWDDGLGAAEAALFAVTEIAMKFPPANMNTYSPIHLVGLSSCNIKFVSSEVTVLLEGGLFTSNTLIVSPLGGAGPNTDSHSGCRGDTRVSAGRSVYLTVTVTSILHQNRYSDVTCHFYTLSSEFTIQLALKAIGVV